MCLKNNGIGVKKQIFFSISSNKLHDFSFKVIPYNVIHFSIPHCHALQEGFFWEDPHLCRYGTLDGLCDFKTGPLDDPLEFVKKEKVIGNKISMFHWGNVLSQQLPDVEEVVSRCM